MLMCRSPSKFALLLLLLLGAGLGGCRGGTSSSPHPMANMAAAKPAINVYSAEPKLVDAATPSHVPPLFISAKLPRPPPETKRNAPNATKSTRPILINVKAVAIWPFMTTERQLRVVKMAMTTTAISCSDVSS